jgi:ABC-type nitrate/sulfonate/bicarbonate transport system ATPase subunit
MYEGFGQDVELRAPLEPALNGREVDLETVVDSPVPVLVVVGDSGIGKSLLLRAAQTATPSR